MSETNLRDPFQAMSVSPEFFKDVKYFVSGTLDEEVDQLLRSGGAVKKSYLSSAVTHCFGGPDFDEIEFLEVSGFDDVPVLRLDWVTRSVQCGTRLPFSGFGLISPKQIFSGLNISTSGLSKEDVKRLWALIVSRGGRFDLELKSDSTHLLVAGRDASDSRKYEASLQRQNRIKIVTPDWVTECWRKGERISEEDFHPRLLIEDVVLPNPQPQRVLVTTPITSLPSTPVLPTPFKFLGLPNILPLAASPCFNLARKTNGGQTPLDVEKEGRINQKQGEQQQRPVANPESCVQSPPNQPQKPVSNLNRQQEIIVQHIGRLTSENRKKFEGMSPREKRHYLGQRGLLLPTFQQQQKTPGKVSSEAKLPDHDCHLNSKNISQERTEAQCSEENRPVLAESSHSNQQEEEEQHHQQQPKKHQVTIQTKDPKSPATSVLQSKSSELQRSKLFSRILIPEQKPDQTPLVSPGSAQPIRFPRQKIQLVQHCDPITRHPLELCLLGCSFFICDYTEDPQTSKFCESWKKVILRRGGEVEELYHPGVTHLICQTQNSSIAAQAVKDEKRLVTVFWLEDVVLNSKMMPPWKAIHFPLPKLDNPCENLILTTTGFRERESDLIKAMISLSGATYTNYLDKHYYGAIICKSSEGEKYRKAKLWNVPAVSVDWLNDVLFGKSNSGDSLTNPKYQTFRRDDPFLVDSEFAPHLMSAWKTPIKVTQEIFQKFKLDLNLRLKRKAELQRLEPDDDDSKRKRKSEDPKLKNSDSENSSSAGNSLFRNNSLEKSSKEKVVENDKTEKSLKETAVDNLSSSSQETDCRISQKSSSFEKSKNGGKLEGPKILLTGFSATELIDLQKMCSELGLEVTTNARSATHLVMSSLNRTISFLCAISFVRFVLDVRWIKDSHKKLKLKDETNYHLRDEAFESRYKCSVRETLHKHDRHKLFEGRIFYLTPSIVPPWKKLRSVIEHAGGKVETQNLKSEEEIGRLNAGRRDPIYLIITCESDLHVVADVIKAKICKVYNPEFVMTSVLNGKVNFDLV